MTVPSSCSRHEQALGCFQLYLQVQLLSLWGYVGPRALPPLRNVQVFRIQKILTVHAILRSTVCNFFARLNCHEIMYVQYFTVTLRPPPLCKIQQ